MSANAWRARRGSVHPYDARRERRRAHRLRRLIVRHEWAEPMNRRERRWLR